MLALVVVLLLITVSLSVVTTGLLRSHADILRALHEIGVGVGDPGADRPVAAPVHLRTGPPLPSGRSSTSVHDVVGVSPGGDQVVISMATSPLTLLAFLSSGCTSCAGFWSALDDPVRLDLLPGGIRVVVVTKGPEWESPEAIAGRAGRRMTVVMSSDAWGDYEVPGSPFFVLVDGLAGGRVGEGVAAGWEQVTDLVRRADADAPRAGREGRRHRGSSGADREAATDVDLRAAGITPGHPSLYPRRLEDVTVPGEARPTGPTSR